MLFRKVLLVAYPTVCSGLAMLGYRINKLPATGTIPVTAPEKQTLYWLHY